MSDVFAIVPASAKTIGFVGVFVALMLGLAGLFLSFGLGARRGLVELSPAALRITGGPYGRSISRDELWPEGARRLDWAREREWAPKRRTNGAGFPGFLSGWFRLHNGTKALLFVTDPTRVVLVPTSNDYVVLVSVADPEGFLRSLNR